MIMCITKLNKLLPPKGRETPTLDECHLQMRQAPRILAIFPRSPHNLTSLIPAEVRSTNQTSGLEHIVNDTETLLISYDVEGLPLPRPHNLERHVFALWLCVGRIQIGRSGTLSQFRPRQCHEDPHCTRRQAAELALSSRKRAHHRLRHQPFAREWKD
ncbi:hypothetical protein BS47DRAFT_1196874 [Hydnum rufescens UP504]|uniref:Uncharacterized protein n=1 Tax=Hydnum rufescens UP504 TaxID=1448309 RepID=A0A9P6ASD0_9AGAM|nr:hypothetical protein BS47DRAFT_1196874 [Hydnum rufescens UP504]